jgi:hypothetical protein
MQAFFQNGDQRVNGDDARDLGARGIWTDAIKSFDAKMLPEPIEEKIDLPAATVKFSDGSSGDDEVGEEDQPLVGFGIVKNGLCALSFNPKMVK